MLTITPLVVTPPPRTQLFAELSQECHRVCLDTAQLCQVSGGELADPRVLRVFRDCSRACRTSLASINVGSHLTQRLLLACKTICEESARLCEMLARGERRDKQFETCAELCLDCAAFCAGLMDDVEHSSSPAEAA